MKDFFSRYKTAKWKQYTLSGFLALMFSFAVLSFSQTNNMNYLTASVMDAGEVAKAPNADVFLQKSDGGISLVFAKDASKVDRVNATILGDPRIFTGLTTTTPDVTVLANSEGIYTVQIKTFGKDIRKGSVLADFHADIKQPTVITLIDTQFTSSGTTYDLASKNLEWQ